MKSIILMRHGKSSWDYGVSDKDRPLKERGINDAQVIAQQFKKNSIEIDFAYSSFANRALHTAVIMLRGLDHDFENFRVTPNLYDFSGETVLNHIQNLGDHLKTIMVFGHNHAFTHLANRWGDTYIDNVPTAGLVHIEFQENSWKSISKGKTVQTLFPKEYK